MQKIKVIFLVFLFLLAGNSLFALTPMETMKKIYRLLYQYDEDAPNATKLKAQINQYFQLEKMAWGAIRDHWDKMLDKQKKEYMELMYRLLEKAVYQDTHENLQKGKVRFLTERVTGARAKVMTNIFIVDEDIEIENEFLLRRNGGIWQVKDIFIDDASLTEDYRSQFNKIISKSGMDGNDNALFPRLRKAVKEEKDKWRKNWKSKKKRRKVKKERRPTLLENF